MSPQHGRAYRTRRGPQDRRAVDENLQYPGNFPGGPIRWKNLPPDWRTGTLDAVQEEEYISLCKILSMFPSFVVLAALESAMNLLCRSNNIDREAAGSYCEMLGDAACFEEGWARERWTNRIPWTPGKIDSEISAEMPELLAAFWKERHRARRNEIVQAFRQKVHEWSRQGV